MEKYLVPAAVEYRMRVAVIVVSAIALAGCETTLPSEMSHTEAKQLAQQIYQRCLDQGVDPGTTEMDVCTKHESYREIDKRLNNRAAVREVGRGLQNAAEKRANQRRPVTCSSTVVGQTARTTCL
ncbi:conserved hypothetical protein [Mesorhizobium escarrei]|uniref:EexN family lipoprotein n=1 Tax=Mesorhizobium escarrei TaxID=666018 RepID=A0ABM9EIX7_9HYPH|nr:conserved hypothetical protein [Mesorhizobium escarrei]